MRRWMVISISRPYYRYLDLLPVYPPYLCLVDTNFSDLPDIILEEQVWSGSLDTTSHFLSTWLSLLPERAMYYAGLPSQYLAHFYPIDPEAYPEWKWPTNVGPHSRSNGQDWPQLSSKDLKSMLWTCINVLRIGESFRSEALFAFRGR